MKSKHFASLLLCGALVSLATTTFGAFRESPGAVPVSHTETVTPSPVEPMTAFEAVAGTDLLVSAHFAIAKADAIIIDRKAPLTLAEVWTIRAHFADAASYYDEVIAGVREEPGPSVQPAEKELKAPRGEPVQLRFR